eukprot:TRINITY_DN1480_c0_g3_i2.p1 TRINITY_DN1480_c0_g3~~TRINITY_DN1480_c0_g3_i2.p1  ORF type:complete len:294 (-),score=36.11 TRINITY_DN1480_c0_g3_i2:14-895(-)
MQVEGLCFLGNKQWAVTRSALTGEHWGSTISVIKEGTVEAQEAWNCAKTTLNTIVSYQSFLFTSGLDGTIYRLSRPLKQDSEPMALQTPHNLPVSVIDLLENKLVSGAWDGHVHLYELDPKPQLVWDRWAHDDFIFCVSWNFLLPNVVGSCSRDKYVKIWDTRQEKPTSSLPFKHPILSLAWNKVSETILALALEDNSVLVLDTRNTAQPVITNSTFHAPINAMQFCPHKKELLALGSDDTSLSVLNADDNKKVFEFNGHSDFVRAVAWDSQQEGILASGSWDQQVLFHSISF